MSESLRWALDSVHSPHLAAADWLARDLSPDATDAISLVTSPATPLDTLILAKEAFKTMRLVGETVADRRLGGHLYLATIAAAMVHHGRRISTQSDESLCRALVNLRDDDTQPEPLRAIAQEALVRFGASGLRLEG